MQRRGDLFHRFVASLKTVIRNGGLDLSGLDLATQQRIIYSRYSNLAQSRGFSLNEAQDIWRLYIQPWVSRKLSKGELQSISSGQRFFFEISVADPRIPFPKDRGLRHYPLRGRIDELDLSCKRVIERTIRGSTSDRSTAFIKKIIKYGCYGEFFPN